MKKLFNDTLSNVLATIVVAVGSTLYIKSCNSKIEKPIIKQESNTEKNNERIVILDEVSSIKIRYEKLLERSKQALEAQSDSLKLINQVKDKNKKRSLLEQHKDISVPLNKEIVQAYTKLNIDYSKLKKKIKTKGFSNQITSVLTEIEKTNKTIIKNVRHVNTIMKTIYVVNMIETKPTFTQELPTVPKRESDLILNSNNENIYIDNPFLPGANNSTNIQYYDEESFTKINILSLPDIARFKRFDIDRRVIAEYQFVLKKIGHFDGPIDGYFDTEMDTDIRQFQKEYFLIPDGWIGVLTRGMLDRVYSGQTDIHRNDL